MNNKDQIKQFIDALQHRMNSREKSICTDIWKHVRNTQKPIAEHHWNRLSKLARDIDLRESQPQKYAKLQKQKTKQQTKKSARWAQTSGKERNFYQSYQPAHLKISRTPSQLIGDRLCLFGISKYNGQPLSYIPTQYLKSILDTKINNRDDRTFIMAHLELRKSGTKLGASVSNN